MKTIALQDVTTERKGVDGIGELYIIPYTTCDPTVIWEEEL